jgi:prepilin-type N-terminal cleavage/methylation domain-containing protein
MSHSMPSAHVVRLRLHRAFTLLEVVVTLVLIGVGLAVVAPVLRPTPRVRDTEASLARVRAQAVRLGTTIDTLVAGRRMRITPLGACIPMDMTPDAPRWDVQRCAPVPSAP